MVPASGMKRRRLSSVETRDAAAGRADDALSRACALWDPGSWACASPESVARRVAVYGRPDPWQSAAQAAEPSPVEGAGPTSQEAVSVAPTVSVVPGVSSDSEASRGGSGCLFIERNSASPAAPAEASAPHAGRAEAESAAEVLEAPRSTPSAGTSLGPAAGEDRDTSAADQALARHASGASSGKGDVPQTPGIPQPGSPRGIKRGGSEAAVRRVAPRGGTPRCYRRSRRGELSPGSFPPPYTVVQVAA